MDDVAAALEAWLIPPASNRGNTHLLRVVSCRATSSMLARCPGAATNKKKTKIRFGVEVGRLSQPRCSLRVSHLTGTEGTPLIYETESHCNRHQQRRAACTPFLRCYTGRRARKWADVRSNTVAVSFAFVVKEGVNGKAAHNRNRAALLILSFIISFFIYLPFLAPNQYSSWASCRAASRTYSSSSAPTNSTPTSKVRSPCVPCVS